MRIIGIDPDKTDCGICELHDGEIVNLYTLSPAKLIEDIHLFKKAGFIFAIENCEQVKTIYAKHINNSRDNQKVGLTIAQSVGMVKGVFSVIHESLKLHECDIVLVPVGMCSAWKNDAKRFKADTGYTKRTNSDKRDAAAIAFYAHKIKSKKP